MIYRAAEWPHGMICERCEYPFRDGDQVFGMPLCVVAEGMMAVEPLCSSCLAGPASTLGVPDRNPTSLRGDEV
jgi:hypothetical protein